MSLFGCKHSQLSEVKEGGYQYCLKCNKAFSVPCSHVWEKVDATNQKCKVCGVQVPIECGHVWEEAGRFDIFNFTGNITGYVITMKCKKCGKMSEFRTGVKKQEN